MIIHHITVPLVAVYCKVHLLYSQKSNLQNYATPVRRSNFYTGLVSVSRTIGRISQTESRWRNDPLMRMWRRGLGGWEWLYFIFYWVGWQGWLPSHNSFKYGPVPDYRLRELELFHNIENICNSLCQVNGVTQIDVTKGRMKWNYASDFPHAAIISIKWMISQNFHFHFFTEICRTCWDLQWRR